MKRVNAEKAQKIELMNRCAEKLAEDEYVSVFCFAQPEEAKPNVRVMLDIGNMCVFTEDYAEAYRKLVATADFYSMAQSANGIRLTFCLAAIWDE